MLKISRAIVSGLALTALIVALAWSFEGPASAQPGQGFRNRDLNGDYAFAAVQCCIIGRFTADGAGNLVGTHTLAGGNDVHHESLECTYSVNTDGTGAMTCDTEKLDGPDAGSTATGTFDFVLADGGRELFSINTDQGGEVEGLVWIAKRQ